MIELLYIVMIYYLNQLSIRLYERYLTYFLFSLSAQCFRVYLSKILVVGQLGSILEQELLYFILIY
jgi:hypothetical protein